MSRLWPDPFHDKGDEFWDFDNMVSEYEWEQEHRNKRPVQKKPETQKRTPKKKVVTCFLIVLAMIFCIFYCPTITLALSFVLLWNLFKDV